MTDLSKTNPRCILSVTNDIATDQRIKKIGHSLMELGFNVMVIGRKQRNSLDMERPYPFKRMRLIFNKGALFYAEYNIRLLIFLLFSRAEIFVANDLDTLLANYLASKIRRKVLVYDSHEYFTEVPELTGKSFAKLVWLKIESGIFPKLKHVYTVNESIAEIYSEKYGIPVHVVRNLPDVQIDIEEKKEELRAKLNLPLDKKILIFQGSGINRDRGGLQIVEAMKKIDAYLLIIGRGDELPEILNLIAGSNLQEKVKYIPVLPYNKLMEYTAAADLGLILDNPDYLNYYYCLPNKLFDYLSAGIPVISTKLIEVEKIIVENQVGEMLKGHTAEDMADGINHILSASGVLESFSKNAIHASKKYHWKFEKEKLRIIYQSIVI